MRLIHVLPLAVKALRRNLMRTMLTMLGVIIGVSAVICVVAIGEGASTKIRDAIASVGDNVVWVEAGGVNRGGVRTGTGGTKSLTLADMHAIKLQIPLIAHASPMVDTRPGVCAPTLASRWRACRRSLWASAPASRFSAP